MSNYIDTIKKDNVTYDIHDKRVDAMEPIELDLSSNHDATVEDLVTALHVDADHPFEGPAKLTYFKNGTQTTTFTKLTVALVYGGGYLQLEGEIPLIVQVSYPPYYLRGQRLVCSGGYSDTKLITISDLFGSSYLKNVTVVHVDANPELDGTESELAGLQVGNTKYKLGGTKLYKHFITISKTDGTTFGCIACITYGNALTKAFLSDYTNRQSICLLGPGDTKVSSIGPRYPGDGLFIEYYMHETIDSFTALVYKTINIPFADITEVEDTVTPL